MRYYILDNYYHMNDIVDVAEQKKYPLSKYRYINLFIFIITGMANGLPVQAFASIDSLVEKQFHYSSVIVTLNVLLCSIIHPFMATPCNIILDKFGIRIGCSIGGVFVILGVWSRTLMQVNYPAWALISSACCSIGNVFILSSPSILAIKWFDS